MVIEPDRHTFGATSGFIVLEGVNGAGKTTLQRRIVEYIRTKGRGAVATREPGATPVGEAIRNLVLSPRPDKITPTAELLLFAADRAEHVAKFIRPTLARGVSVVSDRFFYSTTAFQGFGRGLDRATIDRLNTIAVGETVPDFVILLDLDAATGLARTAGRALAGKTSAESAAMESDAMESEAIDFHDRIRNGFLSLAASQPEPFVVLDARRTPDELFIAPTPILDRWLAALPPPSS